MSHDPIQHYQDLCQSRSQQKQPAWLRAIRLSAAARLAELGFPTRKHEEWKYTPVRPLTAVAFAQSPLPLSLSRVAAEDLLSRTTQGALRVVIGDGQILPAISSLEALPAGVSIRSLREILDTENEPDDLLRQRFALALDRVGDNAFDALNLALFSDGVVIDIPKNTSVTQPIEIVYVGSCSSTPQIGAIRSFVSLARGSQASIIERFVGLSPDGAHNPHTTGSASTPHNPHTTGSASTPHNPHTTGSAPTPHNPHTTGSAPTPHNPHTTGSAPYFTTASTAFFVEENAALDHYKIQQDDPSAFHIAWTWLHQKSHSRVSTFAVSLGGKIARNETEAALDGQGIETTLNGLYLVEGDRFVDNRTFLDHAKPHCHSVEVYKGILSERGKGTFNGKILVRQDAQKTDAKQSNQALLLSDDATIYSKPQLEIFADDVKCTHGATTGYLDEKSMFYARSRGVPEDAARGLLTYAFANALIEGVRLPALQQELSALLAQRFQLSAMDDLMGLLDEQELG
ncbi:Fe-S cluster assembly protein SufD [Myxococcota bacterium]|nr:Fe-S cluster assembly protein SufD [Myxococcota bacterium]